MAIHFDIGTKKSTIAFDIGNVRYVPTGGTFDHRALKNRDAEDQHPIDAITGLRKELNTIPPAAERITNTEIEEMLK